MFSSKNVLLVLLIAGLVVLGYLNFRQQEVISVMNDVLLQQAGHSHQLQVQRQVLEKALEDCETAADSAANPESD